MNWEQGETLAKCEACGFLVRSDVPCNICATLKALGAQPDTTPQESE